MNELAEKEFVFIGEALVLDLANTEVIVRGKRYDLLQTPDDLAQWWDSVRQHNQDTDMIQGYTPVFSPALLESVKTLRTKLRLLFNRVIEGQRPENDEIEFLNSILRMGHPALVWQANSTPQMSYDYGESDNQMGLLLPLALSALHLLASADLSRLRKCHNQRCILLFYDTTKSGTRQWCSAACLDRERSARRYAAKMQSTEQ